MNMGSPADKKISDAMNRIRHAIARGVVDAAGDIRSRAVKGAPVDTGNLRKSAEIFIDGSQSSSLNATVMTRRVCVRFTAPYAGYVHNAPGKMRGIPRNPPRRGMYWDPMGAGPKFLLNAADEVSRRIESYIKRRVSQVMPNAEV